MHVQALMRFVNESVKDHINRIRHGLLPRTRKVETAGPHSVRVSETDHGLTIHYFYKNQKITIKLTTTRSDFFSTDTPTIPFEALSESPPGNNKIP